MARIRTIKPSFWGSRPVLKLSRDARLLAIGLISFAAEDARYSARDAQVAHNEHNRGMRSEWINTGERVFQRRRRRSQRAKGSAA